MSNASKTVRKAVRRSLSALSRSRLAGRHPFQSIEGGGLETVNKLPPKDLWPALHREVFRQYGKDYLQYCFGGKMRLLRRSDAFLEMNRTARFLDQLRAQASARNCVILGNGPSLKLHDFGRIRDCFVIGSNYIFLHSDQMGFLPDLISATNFLVVEQRLDELLALPVPKIFPFYMYNLVGRRAGVYYVNVNHDPEFSEDVRFWASTRSTVTFFNLQVAYFLGFDKTYLIGVDNSYTQRERGEGKVIDQVENDPNHFSPEYFKGLKWQSADTDAMAAVYVLARRFFERSGRAVYNAGIGGMLDVFPRVDYRETFAQSAAPAGRVSISVSGRSSIEARRVFVSINPDLENFLGHHYQFDSKILGVAASQDDDFVALGNSDLSIELNAKFPYLIPCFSQHSHVLGIRRLGTPWGERTFELELIRGIERVKAAFPDAARFEFYMYCAGYRHVKAVKSILNRGLTGDRRMRFHLNVFYPSFESCFGRDSRGLEREVIVDDSCKDKVLLYAGTSAYKLYLEMTSGERIRYLPCASTTFSDDELAACRKSRAPLASRPAICFPGNLRPEKGLRLTVDALGSISRDEFFNGCRIAARWVGKDALHDVFSRVKAECGERVLWIEGQLSDSEFKRMLVDADIIVIPYLAKAFRVRPSGIFSDAVLLEKPVLVGVGTSMAGFVANHGNGAVFDPGNAEDLVAKLKTVVENSARITRACEQARRAWQRDNSWERLYRVFIS